ncbi:unnamed protein product [[Candida] boidinii]|uniref:Unnamed protein product n=1 Tax=Candida boidinii TaxID=5477 RepID=A0A9W6SUQ9_CANBO|nr:unnamed protein product [[Candida] boidinii]
MVGESYLRGDGFLIGDGFLVGDWILIGDGFLIGDEVVSILLVNGEFLTGEDSADENPLSELEVFNFLLSISFLFFFFGVVTGVVDAEP